MSTAFWSIVIISVAVGAVTTDLFFPPIRWLALLQFTMRSCIAPALGNVLVLCLDPHSWGIGWAWILQRDIESERIMAEVLFLSVIIGSVYLVFLLIRAPFAIRRWWRMQQAFKPIAEAFQRQVEAAQKENRLSHD